MRRAIILLSESNEVASLLVAPPQNLKSAGKTLLLITNSPYWYLNAGMKYILGSGWRSLFDCVIASASKPGFYIERTRPFREIVLSGDNLDDYRKENISFEKVEMLSPDKVYSGGCLRELVRLMPALQRPANKLPLVANGIQEEVGGGGEKLQGATSDELRPQYLRL